MATSIAGNFIVRLSHWAEHVLTQWPVDQTTPNQTSSNKTLHYLSLRIQLKSWINFSQGNANLRAKGVNVARADGRQENCWPGCSPCCLMWLNIFIISLFTLSRLFTYENTSRICLLCLASRTNKSVSLLTHSGLFCSSTTPSKKKTNLMPAEVKASTHFFRTSIYSVHWPPHTQFIHEYQWQRQDMPSTTSVGPAQQQNRKIKQSAKSK